MPKNENLSKYFVNFYGGIPYHYAFYILRRSYNLLAEMNDQELHDLTKGYVDIFDSYLQNNIDAC